MSAVRFGASVMGLIAALSSAKVAMAEDYITGTVARTLIQEQGAIVVDVRTIEEHRQKHVPGALLFPLQTLPADRYHLGDFDRPIVVYCRSGRRSAEAAKILKAAGFTKVHNMGPLENWDR